MVVLDTSIIIDHLRQRAGTQTRLLKLNETESMQNLCISVITLQELYEGQSTKNEQRLNQMLSILAPWNLPMPL